MFSPLDLENWYVDRERASHAWLAKKTWPGLDVLFAVALGGFIYFVQEAIFGPSGLANQNGVSSNLFSNLTHISRGIFAILAFSLIVKALPLKTLRYLIPVFCFVLGFFAIDAFLAETQAGAKSLQLRLFVPVIIGLSIFYVKIKNHVSTQRLALAIYTAIHFTWVLSCLWAMQSAGLFGVVAYLFGFKSVIFWFWICSRANDGSLPIFEITNPVNAVRAWLWPRSSGEVIASEKSERSEIWWNGCLNILLGYILLMIIAGLLMQFPGGYGQLFFNYSVHVAVDVATLNVIVGAARLFGYRLIDATYFSFLAKSPGETWRRGSVYTFKFNQEFVFWPALRFFRSYWIALFLAFSMFYLNSLSYGSVMSLVSAADPSTERLEDCRILYFLLHFALICVPARFWSLRFLRISEARRLWLNVLVVHGLNLLVLYVVYGVLGGFLSLKI